MLTEHERDMNRRRFWRHKTNMRFERSAVIVQREIKLIIHLHEYVSRVKGLDLDPWQIDFCNRLEKAFFERDTAAMNAAIAVAPQHGKSIIISQAFPAWMVGHDPMHRIVLACFNLTRSRVHFQAIISIMRGAVHKSIFTDQSTHIPNIVSDKAFSCYTRLHNFDGQHNFTAASLITGLTGVGFDTLIIDDPYRTAEEARSMTYREKSWSFYTEVAQMRGGDNGNVFIMFHRYHQDDLGGRALNTKEFEYWHYDAQFVGDYIHDDGRVYPDAFPREIGEYLSPRRSPRYYERQKRYPDVWNSQFQQRPTADDGNMFDIRLIAEIEDEPKRSEFAFMIRSYDNAASDDDGDFSVGVLQGFRHDGTVHILDLWREQINTGKRLQKQKLTAEKDGKMVIITHPVDPASAGKDIGFLFQQELDGYQVELMPTTQNKQTRAYPASIAVNQGKYTVPKGAPWVKLLKDELNYFPNSTYKDMTDALADGYRKGMEKLKHGLVVKTYDPTRTTIGWSRFAKRFGRQIPNHWEIYAAAKVSNDESLPSGAVLVCRAAENAFIGEAVFVLACYKQRSGSFEDVTRWLKKAIDFFVAPKIFNDGREPEPKKVPLIWLSDLSADEMNVAFSKLRVNPILFDGDVETGIAEMNWYFAPTEGTNPFYPNQKGSRLFLISADAQVSEPTNELGLISLRQELPSWTYDTKGEPQEFGGIVAECLKMILTDFKPRAIELTAYEAATVHIEENLPHLTVQAIDALEDDQLKQQRRLQRSLKIDKLEEEHQRPIRQKSDFLDWLEAQGDD